MKKLALLLFAITLLAALTGCSSTTGSKILTCDGCGTKVTVEKDSNMEEDWIIYCDSCNEELFGDHSILGNG